MTVMALPTEQGCRDLLGEACWPILERSDTHDRDRSLTSGADRKDGKGLRCGNAWEVLEG